MGPALSVDVERDGDSVRIALRGELDLATVGHADAALSRPEVQSSGTVVLDLSGVTFIDSTGLRFLLLADQRAQENRRRLRLVPAAPEVQRIFAMMRLEDRLPFLDR